MRGYLIQIPPPHSVSQTPPVHQPIIPLNAHLNHIGNCNYKTIKHTTMKAIKLTVDANTAICAQIRTTEQDKNHSLFLLGIDMMDDGKIITTEDIPDSYNIIDLIGNILTFYEEYRIAVVKAKEIFICSDVFEDNPDFDTPMMEVNPKVFEGLTYDKVSDKFVGTLIIL